MEDDRSTSEELAQRQFPGLRVVRGAPSVSEPAALSNLVGQLFQLRGYGRKRADRQLQELWNVAAGPEISAQSRPIQFRNGVLQVAVDNAVVLAEIEAFHRQQILKRLQQQTNLGTVRDLKLKLRSPD